MNEDRKKELTDRLSSLKRLLLYKKTSGFPSGSPFKRDHDSEVLNLEVEIKDLELELLNLSE